LEIAYWLPDPISTILVTAPGDVTSAIGILEVTRAKQGRKAVVRFLTRNFEGLLVLDGGKQSFEVNEHGLNFLPAIIAYGRSMTHRGCKYGRSLVPTLPDSSVRVTNNQVNLELLRDRQTQALLVVQGDPKRTSADEPLAANKFIQFPRDGGDARYESPDSKLDEVIKVTERFLSDAAVQANLPLDTFRPELVQGSDASATAARIRAFPLFQRMVRLGNHWSMVELHAGAVVGGLLLQHGGEYREQTIAQLRKDLGLGVKLRPSMPEAESETLSNWQQRTVNFFTEVEEAIDFYSGHLPEEKKADLATAWRTKNDPTTKSGGEVFQYHVEGGVLVINEVRDRLGLPQVAWGNVTVPELKERGRVMPNESKEADEPEGEVE
jgi:hypothetical protein